MNKKIVIKRFRINEVTLIAFLVSSILLFPAPTAWADSETFESQGEVRIPETPVPGNGEIDKEIGCLALPPAKCPQGSDDKPLKCLGTACQKETDDLPIQPVEDSQDQQKRDDRRKTSREERKETEETEQTSYPTRQEKWALQKLEGVMPLRSVQVINQETGERSYRLDPLRGSAGTIVTLTFFFNPYEPGKIRTRAPLAAKRIDVNIVEPKNVIAIYPPPSVKLDLAGEFFKDQTKAFEVPENMDLEIIFENKKYTVGDTEIQKSRPTGVIASPNLDTADNVRVIPIGENPRDKNWQDIPPPRENPHWNKNDGTANRKGRREERQTRRHTRRIQNS